MISSIFWPRLLYFVSLFSSAAVVESQQASFIKSLSFQVPNPGKVTRHRFWQPVREARGISGKLCVLFGIYLFGVKTTDDYDQLERLSLLAFGVFWASGLQFGVLNVLFSELVPISFPVTLLIGSMLFLISGYISSRGAENDARWVRFFFFKPSETGDLDIAPFCRERMREIYRKAIGAGAENIQFRHESTKLDPIVSVKMDLRGEELEFAVAVYYKGCNIPICQ